MSIDHSGRLDRMMRFGLHGDSLIVYPKTSGTKRICGYLKYAMVERNGIEVRQMLFQLARCDLKDFEHGTICELYSDRNNLDRVKVRVTGNNTPESGLPLLVLAKVL